MLDGKKTKVFVKGMVKVKNQFKSFLSPGGKALNFFFIPFFIVYFYNMKQNYDGQIYKPLMAGLFAGYIATVLNIVYDVFFRESTSFPLHELINVSTIIFATLFVLTLAGIVFAFFQRYFKSGLIIYVVLSMLLSVVCIYGIEHVQRSADANVTLQFQHLLLGIFIITGLFATVGIPYLVRHSHIYMDDK